MKSVRNWLAAGIAAAMCAVLLSGCGPAVRQETEIIEEQTEAPQEEAGYENMVVKALPNGEVLRIKDIARVELGSLNYNFIAETNGCPSVNISITQTSGSNANAIIEQIDAEMEEIAKSLPVLNTPP